MKCEDWELEAVSCENCKLGAGSCELQAVRTGNWKPEVFETGTGGTRHGTVTGGTSQKSKLARNRTD